MKRSRIGCAVLAAGSSSRLGQPKQLVVFRGDTLVRRAVSAARASMCDAVVAVVGAYASLVEADLIGSGAEIVASHDWRDGMGASIRAAAEWAIAREHDALVLAVCDQPRLDARCLDALVQAWLAASPDSSVASAYAGGLGVPALFPKARFRELSAIDPARGASALLRGAVNVARVAWPEGAFDVDTARDLDALHRLGEGASTV